MHKRLEPRHKRALAKLLAGNIPELCTNHTTMSRLMTVLLDEVNLPWQTCVALCYVAMIEEMQPQPQDQPELPTINPLTEFLKAKDDELDQLELEKLAMTRRLPKYKTVSTTA